MITGEAYHGGPILALDGDLPSPDIFSALLRNGLPVVAADGAALKLRERNIRPDVIIGDMDTLRETQFDPFFADTDIIRDMSQEVYDGEKALQWIIESGHDRATVLGAGGGMIDHVLNNFSLLARFSDRLRIHLRQEEAIGYIVRQNFRLTTERGNRVSLIPLPEARITTRGLHWNLQDDTLRFGGKEGASNWAAEDAIEIEVAGGVLVVFYYEHIKES